MDLGSNATHFLLMYDASGKITGVGKIDQDLMRQEELGTVVLMGDDRHFVQLPIGDDDALRNASHADIMEAFAIDHQNGAEARLVRRSNK